MNKKTQEEKHIYWQIHAAALLLCNIALLSSFCYVKATAIPMTEQEPAPVVVVKCIPSTPQEINAMFSDIPEEPAEPEEPAKPVEPRESMEVPHINTKQKTYMDYHAITSKNSMQYKLQQKANTTPNGLRQLDGRYLVAMGTYYSDYVGRKLDIQLENGNVIPVMIGDVKANAHTDAKNQHRNGNVVEFIVDSKKLDKTAKLMGDISYIDGFEGQIKSIERIG